MEKLSVVQLPSHFAPTHETLGLPGFPAIDVFAPGGSPVAAPLAGTVIKTSGHPPKAFLRPDEYHGPYGWSIYLQTIIGVFFLTHFGQKAINYWHVGAKIRRGQYLGKIAYFSKVTNGETPDHIHEGFHAGIWTP